MTDAARRCYRALEALHSMIYFVPEAEAELTAVGLRPGRMTYFAQRSAAMGPVGPGVVAATFFSYNPDVVSRHLPRAWTLAAPDVVLAARLRAAESALTRVLGDAAGSVEVREAATLARRVTDACPVEGRPLFAAHADLATPDSDLGALFHAATLLREFRGDGHVAALVTAGLSGLEALVTHTATGRGFVPRFAAVTRGWSAEQWDGASRRLAEQGVLDADGAVTETGRRLRADLEDATDRASSTPFSVLEDGEVGRLTELGRALTRRALAAGAFPDGVFAGP